jgi:hypothetical protein
MRITNSKNKILTSGLYVLKKKRKISWQKDKYFHHTLNANNNYLKKEKKIKSIGIKNISIYLLSW